MSYYDLSRLTLAERIELAELQRLFDEGPVLVDVARLNVLQGKATAPEQVYRLYQQHPARLRSQRQGGTDA